MPDPGYAIIPNVVAQSEIKGLLEATAASPDRTRAGARHLLKHPLIAAFASDPRLIAIAGGILGGTAQPFKGTFFDKSPASNWLVGWHQDRALPLKQRREKAGWGPWSVKAGVVYAQAPASALAKVVALRIHLDDSHAGNGPLRVLPGTHALGVLTDEEMAELKQKITPVDCLAPKGGIVAMRPLIIHASSKSVSDAPRRVIHIEYAESSAIDEMELAFA